MTDIDPADLEPPAEPDPEPKPKKGSKATLAVVGPVGSTSFTVETDDGDTLVIDRRGTEVPAKAVQDLIEAAALSGVTLAETE